MRLFVALATVLCLLFPTTATARQEPGAGAAAYQLAEADWLDLRNRTFYFAMGVRGGSAPTGVVSEGYVGRGKCEVQRTKHFTSVTCFGRGYGGEVGVDAFQMDPALASAHLEISTKGYDHVVDWTGEELPMSGAQAAGGGGLGADAAAGVARMAPADATIFGERLKGGGHFAFGVLVEGAAAYVFAEGRSIWFGRDGVPRMRATYRIPR